MKLKPLKLSKPTIEQIVYGGILALIVLMPFHAFLTTYFGNLFNIGHTLQAWKEVVILLLAAVAGFYLFSRPKTRPKLDRINYLVVAIIIWALAVSFIRFGSLEALVFGIKTDLMPLIVFIIAQIVAARFDDEKVYNLIVWPATAICVIAVLQAFVIPPQFLTQLGYNSSTIIPAQYVDSTTMVRRAFSTLGGPNQLGAYLILPITLVMARLMRKFDYKKLFILLVLLGGLYLTYSRSAWLGAAIAIIVTIFLGVEKSWRPKILLALLSIGVIGLVYFASQDFCRRDNIIQYYLLHGSCSDNTLKGSDKTRLVSFKQGLTETIKNPLGKGLGTAGPASYYTLRSLITENWYLQIAIEIGLVGLGLLLAFFGLNAIELWRQIFSEQSLASIGLFASIIGLAATNMFLHSMGDSTLAIVFFALLGIQHGRRT